MTYTYPYTSKAELNYIFVNKKWINSTGNCEACSSFDGVFFYHRIDWHRLVWVNAEKKKKKQTFKSSQYDWFSLADKYIRNPYTVTVRNKFDTLQEKTETHTLKDEYENFVPAKSSAYQPSQQFHFILRRQPVRQIDLWDKKRRRGEKRVKLIKILEKLYYRKVSKFHLVSFWFNDIPSIMGYLMPKPSF